LPVLKRPAQGGDVEPQVAFLNRDIWPDSRHQPLLADNFTGAFDKNDKNVERSSAQMNWAARLLKVSVRWKQAKWTERNRVRSRSGLFVSHLHSPNISGEDLHRNLHLLAALERWRECASTQDTSTTNLESAEHVLDLAPAAVDRDVVRDKCLPVGAAT
jgi:hypothetical protein